jgi:hypothetical protein
MEGYLAEPSKLADGSGDRTKLLSKDELRCVRIWNEAHIEFSDNE